MKLSANARGFVKTQVTDAFREEYRKADDAVKAIEKKAEGRYEKFKADLQKVLDRALEDVRRAISKNGLTPDGGKFDEGMHLVLCMTDSHYSQVESRFFAETKVSEHDEDSEYAVRCAELRGVEAKIAKAVNRALFEIEVHGKRDTLEQIVAEVVKAIKEEK